MSRVWDWLHIDAYELCVWSDYRLMIMNCVCVEWLHMDAYELCVVWLHMDVYELCVWSDYT